MCIFLLVIITNNPRLVNIFIILFSIVRKSQFIASRKIKAIFKLFWILLCYCGYAKLSASSLTKPLFLTKIKPFIGYAKIIILKACKIFFIYTIKYSLSLKAFVPIRLQIYNLEEYAMESLVVTRMEETMIEECADLFISTFSREPWNDVYESKDQVITFFKNHFANNYFLGYVAKVEGKIQGLCIGMKKPWIKGLEYYIDEFCIDYNLQGKGIGSLFIKEIEMDLMEEGLNGIMLNTEKDFPSFQFYKKNGFEALEDLVIMGKVL